ncbi:unnamed protein product, partial [Darwinula stevensoni]
QPNPPVQEVVDSGAIPSLISILEDDENPDTQYEALWALTNVAGGSSTQTRALVDEGALPHFVRLLKSPHQQIQEQSAWAVGNIIGDGPELRQLGIESGAIEPLVALYKSDAPITTLRTLAWTLSNLFRRPPYPPAVVDRALPVTKSLMDSSDEEVLLESLWGLTYFTDTAPDNIQKVVDSGVIPRVVALIPHDNPKISSTAVRLAGNIASGSAEQTQALLSSSLLSQVLPVLDERRTNRSLRKCIHWMLSNVAAGTQEQIQSLLDSGILPLVAEDLKDPDQPGFVKKEALWVVSNMVECGTPEVVQGVVDQGVLEPLCI